MSLKDGYGYYESSTFDNLMKAFKNVDDYMRQIYPDKSDREHWVDNWQNEFHSCSVRYENEDSMISRRSVLFQDGTLKFNSYIDKEDNKSYEDGFGLYIGRLSKKSFYYKMGADGTVMGPCVMSIYNSYSEKLLPGYIGLPQSYYNRVPVQATGQLFRDYKASPLRSIDELCLCYEPEVGISYAPVVSHQSNGVTKWKFRYSSYEWFKQLPKWLNSNNSGLDENLQIVASSILATKVNTLRHLYLCISHKKETRGVRAFIVSKVNDRLCQVQIDAFQIKLIEKVLETYNGYTEDIYVTWYYLPIISPLESGKFCMDIEEKLSYVAV